METTILNQKKVSGFQSHIDQMEALGTQIQWLDQENAEAGTVLLAQAADY